MQPRSGAAALRGGRIMEIICRQCEGSAFRILPEESGIVTAECVVCGTLTLIEIPRPSAHSCPAVSTAPKDHRCQPANGYRRDLHVA
jgi:hypothetical protein